MSAVMSFMCRENNKGPRTVPCGTPDTTAYMHTVEELSFREGRVQLSLLGHFAREFSLPGHIKRSFLVQKGTSILDHLALFSHLHSFTGTIGIFLS